jgi:hypothetical protein
MLRILILRPLTTARRSRSLQTKSATAILSLSLRLVLKSINKVFAFHYSLNEIFIFLNVKEKNL